MSVAARAADAGLYTAPASGAMAFAAGFVFSARAVVVLLCVNVLGTDPRTGAEAGLILNLLLLVAVAFHSLGAAARSTSSILCLPAVRWVSAFLALACCSLAWSATVSLPTSIAYWCGVAADVAIVLILFRARPVDETANSMLKGFVAASCALALLAWIMPTQSDLRLGDEEFFNTNQIGNLCAFGILFAQYLGRRTQGRWGSAIAFLSITLLRSLSKTTIIALLLSEAFLVVQDRSMRRRTKVLLTVGAMLLILVFWGLFEAYYDVYTTAGNQAQTLTGRTGIWAYVLNEAIDKPWLGHGFDSMWKVIPPFGPDRFEARHAENELLQQFYTYGVAGLVIVAGLYGSLIRAIRRLPSGPVPMLLFTIVIFVLIRGLAEAEPFDLLLPCWAVVVLSLVVDDLAPFRTQPSGAQQSGAQLPASGPAAVASEQAFSAGVPIEQT
ncbi:MAG TPA: O-antigen ligase family protein [Acidisarcina sp.]